MEKDAIVYCAHRIGASTARELRRLDQQAPAHYDLFVCGCTDAPELLEPLRSERVTVRACTSAELRLLPYPRRQATADWVTRRGSADLQQLRLFRDHPQYRRYWFIEYDVRYTGHWGEFLTELDRSAADLLCTGLDTWMPGSSWPHWSTFHSANAIVESSDLALCMLSLCRASHDLLAAIDRVCVEGWAGHPEVLWPTAARRSGLAIEEIGGHSRFTPPTRKGRFYGFGQVDVGSVGRLGTFAAWPAYSESSDFAHHGPDILWHPVKD